MPLKESGEFVWFLAYEHKHGTDESCFDSEKSALVEAKRIDDLYELISTRPSPMYISYRDIVVPTIQRWLVDQGYKP